MFNRNKELKQRILELEKTCDDLEKTIDMWKELCNSKDLKAGEMQYRLQLAEDDIEKLNNIISNLMEERNKLTTKKVRKARKVETIKNDTICAENK